MTKDELKRYVDAGLTQRQIATEVSRSQTSVKYWLKKYNLKTLHTRGPVSRPSAVNACKKHGASARFRFYPSKKRYVCSQCESEIVTERRREIKRILVKEKGGGCAVCGYNKSFRALHFHHVDPTRKIRVISNWPNSLKKARLEVEKCELVCSNCHMEIEEGITSLCTGAAS